MYGERGAVPAFFKELGLDQEAGLGLTFSCNLIPGKQRNSTQPDIQLLRKEEQISRVLSTIEWTHCSCVIALLENVYTVLTEAFAGKFGKPSDKGVLQSDSWKQKPPWSVLQSRNGSSILLARVPTHPSWRHSGWSGIPQYGIKLTKLAKAKLNQNCNRTHIEPSWKRLMLLHP